MLELRQTVELRKLEDNIELAKLEERFVDEYEQNMFDNNELTKINTPLEFGYASPRTATLEETKGEYPVLNPYLSEKKPVELSRVPASSPSETDTIQRLAETFASLSHTPPMEVTKFVRQMFPSHQVVLSWHYFKVYIEVVSYYHVSY